ncbi:MAG: nucleoside triphosphate pyrophosphohydrolase [Chloroflexota bacterium]|nr:nucleoside triphosphate pyrophosphohydrolase [Chloroflexota bacterium]
MMDKLVRDLVPEQLAARGVAARASRYDDPAFLEALRAKLVEESVEYYAAADDEEAVAELADLMEVVLALAEMHGADAAALDEARRAKLAARGGFHERFRLVTDEP